MARRKSAVDTSSDLWRTITRALERVVDWLMPWRMALALTAGLLVLMVVLSLSRRTRPGVRWGDRCRSGTSHAVTQREADRATEIARSTSGVQKVVRVFEIISEAELSALKSGASPK